MAKETLEDRISALYRLHPREFVAARNDLAAEIKQDDADRAKEIRRLRKPTLAAWGLNVAAQDAPGRVEELREAGAALRRAQEQAVDGGADNDLRAAEERRRKVASELTDAAVDVAGDGQREQIEATVEAASVDDEAGDAFAMARLVKPRRRPSGLGDLASMLSASAGARRTPDRKKSKDLKRKLGKVEAALERHNGELRRAEERLTNAQKAVDSARERVDADIGKRDDLLAQLDEASSP